MIYRYETKFHSKDGIIFAGECEVDDSITNENSIKTAVRDAMEERYGDYFNIKKHIYYLLIIDENDSVILEWKKKENIKQLKK